MSNLLAVMIGLEVLYGKESSNHESLLKRSIIMNGENDFQKGYRSIDPMEL